MILIENQEILREQFPLLWDVIKNYQPDAKDQSVTLEEGKNGWPTLVVEQEGKKNYLHSKYDPVQEAERFVAQLEGVEEYQHVFFYGVGLGYHVEAFAQKYPNLKITLYEPNIEAFIHLLATRSLKKLPLKRLNQIYVETSPAVLDILLKDFTDFLDDKVFFVSLPSYERVFSEHFKGFSQVFREILINKKTSLNVNYGFEKRWTVNSLTNFNDILFSPGIFEKKPLFSGRPAIIAAAGPSLSEDFDQLRYIKEKGLAYIFAVGSAINALVNNGIEPDAVCAYDPSPLCIKVFEGVIDQSKDNFPLIFGSSIGYEVVQQYRGPKLNMIINQDTFSQYCLRHKDGSSPEIMHDAPTIALVTLELLFKLGCNPIILAGQNLSYKNLRPYADGIHYEHVPEVVDDAFIKKCILVDDVNGGKVYTTKIFDNMRRQMEAYIKCFQGIEIINTTKGGARIEGAPFEPIDQVIANRLPKQRVVEKDWYKASDLSYDSEYLFIKYRKLQAARKDAQKQLANLQEQLRVMERLVKQANENQLLQKIEKFDKELKQLLKNDYYLVLIKPMERTGLELLAKKINDIKFEGDPVRKGRKIVKNFGDLISRFQNDVSAIDDLFISLEKVIAEYAGSSGQG